MILKSFPSERYRTPKTYADDEPKLRCFYAVLGDRGGKCFRASVEYLVSYGKHSGFIKLLGCFFLYDSNSNRLQMKAAALREKIAQSHIYRTPKTYADNEPKLRCFYAVLGDRGGNVFELRYST